MVAPAAPELVIERVFDAPRARVWHAWTDPEQMLKWGGPRSHPVTQAEGEFKVGGKFRACLRSVETGEDLCPAKKIKSDFRPGGKWRTILYGTQQGQDLCHGGKYLEIVEPERLVYTFAWNDHPEMPDNEMVITLTFEEVGPKKTKLTLRQTQFLNVEQRDGHNVGWTGTFDRLGEFLAKK
jgi:uncharacterized protein YndB with AHSA1/START domain